MPQRAIVPSVAENLCALAKDFKSGDPVQSTAIKREFKLQSKNDVVRAVVYLMEVIGSRDQQFKALQDENKDLKELLKVNEIEIDEDKTENAPATSEVSVASSTNGSTGSDEAVGTTTDSGVYA
jgi:hypothetical protein